MPRPPVPLSQLRAPPDAERRLRLLEIVRRRMRERRYSRRTQRAYLDWIRRFVIHHGRRDPRDMGTPEVRAFLSDLAVRGQVSASTQNQALAALTFLYDHAIGHPLPRVDGLAPARKSRHVPVVLSPGEVKRILRQMDDRARLCAALMYGSGLRVLECVSLRVKDIDFDRHEIVVRGGKGGKDRRTPLAESCVGLLRRQLREAADVHAMDARNGVDGAGLDESLMRKYPGAARDRRWQWVFPAARTYVDPHTSGCGGGAVLRAYCQRCPIRRLSRVASQSIAQAEFFSARLSRWFAAP